MLRGLIAVSLAGFTALGGYATAAALEEDPVTGGVLRTGTCGQAWASQERPAAKWIGLLNKQPTKANWDRAVENFGDSRKLTPRECLLLFRLRRQAQTFVSFRGYEEAAWNAEKAYSPREVIDIVDEAQSNWGFLKGNAGLNDLRQYNVERLNQEKAYVRELQTNPSKGGSVRARMNDAEVLVCNHDYEGAIGRILALLPSATAAEAARARLDLGYAYVKAGKRVEALQSFQAVQGSEFENTVAAFWVTYLTVGVR